jgi:phosphopantetheine adenylyltransferase
MATLLKTAMEDLIKWSPRKFLNVVQKAHLSLPGDILEILWPPFCKDILTPAFSSADPDRTAAVLSVKGVISEEHEAHINLASTPTEKATFLTTAVEDEITNSPEKFQDFLNVVHETDLSNIVETLKLWSDYFNEYTILTSSADLNKIATAIEEVYVIPREVKEQVRSEMATLLKTAMEDLIKWSPRKFLNVVQKAHLSLPGDILEILWPPFCKDILTPAFLSADPDTTAAVLSVKGVISKEDEAHINLASTPIEKATLLTTAVEHQLKCSPEKFQDFLNALQKANPLLPGDVVEALWSDYSESVYKQYLDYLYASLENRQWPTDQWPPAATKKYFRLAMIKSATVQRGHIDDSYVQMTITGKVDDILREKYPIQLEGIFKETDRQQQVSKEKVQPRRVILLEGAPGCGKSTLSVYICQQWEKGQLFNQFKLVILVRLRDPAVKNAEDLADLLPCSNARTAQLLAGIMMEMKCQDVLFILNGWDELPISLRKKSIFGDLVSPYLQSSHPLSKSTVIVTSRPIASGDLPQVVSSCVEILGFTAEELYNFFLECLKGNIEAVKTLLERIKENPEVAGSCYLPLNATILVHLFKNDQNRLPTTLYGIFSSLILICIKRHLKLRTPQYKDVPIESLDQLPEFAMKPFLFLCQLAYDGIMEDKVVFTNLSADVNTLSLLQGVESFIEQDKAVSHNFIHLSIQELLAAWYIATQLSASEQVSKFNELFEKSRFNAVFRFYAAITKLKTPGIKEVVMNIVKKYKNDRRKVDGSLLMVSLLHCLYEAQDPSLCESVAQEIQQCNGLDLTGTTLSPSDCLSIGYFLAHVCKMEEFNDNFKVALDSHCSIGDQGCKYLISGLCKYLDVYNDVVTNLLTIDIGKNDISHHGLHHLSTLLKTGCVDYLRLSENKLVSSEDDASCASFDEFVEHLKNNTTLRTLELMSCGLDSKCAESLVKALAANKVLDYLCLSENKLVSSEDDASCASFGKFVEQLKNNTTLRTLKLMGCGLDSKCAESLAEALAANKYLEELKVGSNPLGDNGIQHLARALRVNQDLKILVLVNCGMTDVGLKRLAESLQHNDGLTELQIFDNGLTEGIVPVLIECLKNHHSLIKL